jgi:DNA modification methylase
MASKTKTCIGIPWRVAFALQADGWYLRDAVIWHKPAPMPGSQRDRCTASYEFIFQLTKRERYFFDLEAVKEPCQTGAWDAMPPIGGIKAPGNNGNATYSGNTPSSSGYRTPRNVWTPAWSMEDAYWMLEALTVDHGRSNVWKMAHEGFNEAHFATFPVELPTRCIKASTSERGCCGACGKPVERVIERNRRPTRPGKDNTTDATGLANRDELRHVTATSTVGWSACGCGKPLVPCRVLDPFNGAGTTGVAAVRLGCDYTGGELNPEYAAMSERRIGREKSPATFRDDRDLVGNGLFAGADNA